MDYIQELAKNGFFVEPSLTNKLAKIPLDEFNSLISKLKKQNIVVINDIIFNKFFKADVKIINEFNPTTKFSIQDYVKMLNSRYDFIQDILMKKVELTNMLSINKVGLGKVGVIGIVKEKEERGENYLLRIEDPTGEIQVVASKNIAEKVNLDDIIAVSGNINNKIFFAEKISYPDIPLREANYSSDLVKIAFTKKNIKADYIITKDSIRDVAKDRTITFNKPVLLKISGIIILLAFDVEPLDILRKRFIHTQNTDFLINFVPDIILNNKGINTNYKGVSIIPENTLIDLSNRETSSL